MYLRCDYSITGRSCLHPCQICRGEALPSDSACILLLASVILATWCQGDIHACLMFSAVPRTGTSVTFHQIGDGDTSTQLVVQASLPSRKSCMLELPLLWKAPESPNAMEQFFKQRVGFIRYPLLRSAVVPVPCELPSEV